MLISQKSKETIDSCRFCWMCRHICPVGNATGQERNTARARALALSLVERGAEPLSGVADNIYECTLCGACTNDCITGWDPVKFTKEVRLELALNGETPSYISKLIDNIFETGNVYGMTGYSEDLKSEIEKLPKSSDTLLFLGKDAIYKSPKSAVNAIKLLRAAGVDFTVLSDEPDSGYALDFLIGAADETKAVMQKTAQKLDFKTIVTYDPADAKVFLREYKEWGIKLKGEVKTFTSFVAELISSGKLKVKKSDKTFTVQDSSILARDLEESKPIREILSYCGNVKEMLLYNKDTVLAGNLIMNEYMPLVMADVAKARVINAKNMNAETLVTESPAEYEMLKSVGGIDIMSVEEVVLQCL